MKYTFLLGIVITFLPACFREKTAEQEATGTIILLNGTSSAGKTSIVRAFEKIKSDLYISLIGDEFAEEYAQNHPIDESRRDESNYQILKAMFAQAKQLADSGKNVLIDTVEFDKHYEEYCAILDCNRIVKVLVYCPLDILIERVAMRKKSGDPKEDRPLNLSFGQFTDIYKLQESPDEVVVDCIKTSCMRKALDVAKQEVRQLMKEAGVEEEDFDRNLELFSLPFEEQYKLYELDEIVLTPIHKWDLIVSCVNSPEEIVDQIIQLVRLRSID